VGNPTLKVPPPGKHSRDWQEIYGHSQVNPVQLDGITAFPEFQRMTDGKVPIIFMTAKVMKHEVGRYLVPPVLFQSLLNRGRSQTKCNLFSPIIMQSRPG
jgi:CheY-like chemotaxis protein